MRRFFVLSKFLQNGLQISDGGLEYHPIYSHNVLYANRKFDKRTGRGPAPGGLDMAENGDSGTSDAQHLPVMIARPVDAQADLSGVGTSGRNSLIVPAVIADLGERASERFLTFFTDTIRNPNTRSAYARNAGRFFLWCQQRDLRFDQIRSYHVSAWLEEMLQTLSPPSVKQNLATVRMLFDWLILGQI
ncbi:MAG: hypothetical protein RJA81_363, partial [Planctomycetota bacterium]